jgi:hypothetical protein
MATGVARIREMTSGEEHSIKLEEIVQFLKGGEAAQAEKPYIANKADNKKIIEILED